LQSEEINNWSIASIQWRQFSGQRSS